MLGTILLSALTLLGVLSLIAFRSKKKDSFGDRPIGFAVTSFIAFMFVFIMVIILFLNRAESYSKIRVYDATKELIIESRKTETVENAALTMKIIEINADITIAKYWNSYFDLWTPDEYCNLELLK